MKALILQVFYQPEGVSLRFYPQPEANAFRLIQPNRCNNYYLFNLLSGTLSNALRLILKSEFDAPLAFRMNFTRWSMTWNAYLARQSE